MQQRKTYTEEKKTALLKEWQESHMSAKDFALQRGILPNTFYYWRKKLLKQANNSFVEVSSKVSKIVAPSLCADVFKIKTSNFEIEVPLSANKEELKNLFFALDLL